MFVVILDVRQLAQQVLVQLCLGLEKPGPGHLCLFDGLPVDLHHVGQFLEQVQVSVRFAVLDVLLDLALLLHFLLELFVQLGQLLLHVHLFLLLVPHLDQLERHLFLLALVLLQAVLLDLKLCAFLESLLAR